MVRVNLHGDLQDFGHSFDLRVSSVAETIRAIDANVPGFLTRLAGSGHSYRIMVNGAGTSESFISAPMHKDSIVDIVPVISGGKSDVGMIIAGVALVAFVVVTGGSGGALATTLGSQAAGAVAGQLIMGVGIALVSAGLAGLAAPSPRDDGNQEEIPGAAQFNGPVNTVQQGMPVPVGYGRLIVGGATISAGLVAEDIATPATNKINPWLAEKELIHYSFNYGDSEPLTSNVRDLTIVVPNLATGPEPEPGTNPVDAPISLQQLYHGVSYLANQSSTGGVLPREHGYYEDTNAATKDITGSDQAEARSLLIEKKRDRVIRVDDFDIPSDEITLSLWVNILRDNETFLRYSSLSNSNHANILSSEFSFAVDGPNRYLYFRTGSYYKRFSLATLPTISYSNRVYYSPPGILSSAWRNIAVRIPKDRKLSGVRLQYGGLSILSSSTNAPADYVMPLGTSNHRLSIGGSWIPTTTDYSIYSGNIDEFRLLKGSLADSALLSLFPSLKGKIDAANTSVANAESQAEADEGGRR